MAPAADNQRTGAPVRAQAERAVELMEAMSNGLRGCAILDAGGRSLAASGERELWGAAARRLLDAAGAAGGREHQRPVASGDLLPAEHVHVATEEGEVYATRAGALAMVAVTDRFTLAALVLSDMRMILRDLAAGEVVDRRAPERGEVPAERESEEEVVAAGPEAATPAVD